MRDEAKAVATRLKEAGGLNAQQMKELISPDDSAQFGADALTVINALMERDWRIVHIAGHGEPPEMLGPVPTKPGDPPQQLINPRGVVLSGESFLGPREIHNMRVVPGWCLSIAAIWLPVRPTRFWALPTTGALRRQRGRGADQHWRALCRCRRLGRRGRARGCNDVLYVIAVRPAFLDAVAEARCRYAEAATRGRLTSVMAIPIGCFAALHLMHSSR